MLTNAPRTGRPSPSPRGGAASGAFASLAIALLVVVGSGLLLYPSAASWFSATNQAKVVEQYRADLDDTAPAEVAKELRRARRYNNSLNAGAVVAPGERKPTSTGDGKSGRFAYDSLLNMNGTGIMGHLLIPEIDLDLPVGHGTSDDTLRHTAGHLEGSHLPVGGQGTHSVIAAHRGLAEAEMFDRLDELEPGDHFFLNVFGETLAYEVAHVRVVLPEQSEFIRPHPDRDLVTLVTCTPLGINSHRILVTGERLDPTPARAAEAARTPLGGPGFPYWAVGMTAALTFAAVQVWPRRRETGT